MINLLSTTSLCQNVKRRTRRRVDLCKANLCKANLCKANLPNGFTLLELLFVIATTTVLMVVCVKWMAQSMKFSSTIRTRTADHQTLDRLARQFRIDVRNSNSMAIAGNALTLETDSGELTYTIDEQTLIAKQPLKGTVVRSAQYRFKKGMQMRWDTDEMPATIGLVIERKQSLPSTVPKSLPLTQAQPTSPADVKSRPRIELFVKARPRQ